MPQGPATDPATTTTGTGTEIETETGTGTEIGIGIEIETVTERGIAIETTDTETSVEGILTVTHATIDGMTEGGPALVITRLPHPVPLHKSLLHPLPLLKMKK